MGTPEHDLDGWNTYVDQHRNADPTISKRGQVQSQRMADYLVKHLRNQASCPVQIITSPMRRALETILPTVVDLNSNVAVGSGSKVQVIVNTLYHESEGCHNRNKAGASFVPPSLLHVSYLGQPLGCWMTLTFCCHGIV